MYTFKTKDVLYQVTTHSGKLLSSYCTFENIHKLEPFIFTFETTFDNIKYLGIKTKKFKWVGVNIQLHCIILDNLWFTLKYVLDKVGIVDINKRYKIKEKLAELYNYKHIPYSTGYHNIETNSEDFQIRYQLLLWYNTRTIILKTYIVTCVKISFNTFLILTIESKDGLIKLVDNSIQAAYPYDMKTQPYLELFNVTNAHYLVGDVKLFNPNDLNSIRSNKFELIYDHVPLHLYYLDLYKDKINNKVLYCLRRFNKSFESIINLFKNDIEDCLFKLTKKGVLEVFFNLKFNANFSFNEQGLTNLKTIQDNIQSYMTPYGVNIVIYLLNNSIVFSMVVDNIYNYNPQLSQIKINEIPLRAVLLIPVIHYYSTDKSMVLQIKSLINEQNNYTGF